MVVHEDVAVGKVEDTRPAVLPVVGPAAVPHPPADLERDERLAGAGRKRQEGALLAGEDVFHRTVDCDFLAVARCLARRVQAGQEQTFRGFL